MTRSGPLAQPMGRAQNRSCVKAAGGFAAGDPSRKLREKRKTERISAGVSANLVPTINLSQARQGSLRHLRPGVPAACPVHVLEKFAFNSSCIC